MKRLFVAAFVLAAGVAVETSSGPAGAGTTARPAPPPATGVRAGTIAAGTVTNYPVPGSSPAPYGIAAGSDGRIWFTDLTNRAVGRMTTSGSITAADVVADPGGEPAQFITPGPGGAMWMGGSAHILRVPTSVTSSSQITALGPHGGGGIVAGPDNRLWFTYDPNSGVSPNYLGAITTTGSEHDYQVGPAGSPTYISSDLTVGADHELWIGADAGVARMSTSGVIGSGDVFPLPSGSSVPFALALGPDGNVWFTEDNPAAVGKVTPGGKVTLFDLPSPSSLPLGIAAGPDGRMWFAERNADAIGAIPTSATSSSAIHEYPIGGSNVGAINIVAGPDGRMWFNESNEGALGAITTGVTLGPPDTKLVAADIHPKKGSALFRFQAIGSATGFQCRLVRVGALHPPKFKVCKSPKTYSGLSAGEYKFAVRAVGAAGPDPTPAHERFTITG